MKKRKIISLFILFLLIIGFIFVAEVFKTDEANLIALLRADSELFLENEADFDLQIKIAACPTFYYMLEQLKDIPGVVTVKTGSTKESLNLLSEKRVDLAISGRALKTEEPDFLFEVIGPGYDFIFKNEIVIIEHEMALIPFYTNLSLKEIIRDFDYISENNLFKVEDPYDYLDSGVIITRLDKIEKGDVVHIFKEDGSRLRYSRVPRLYYRPDFPEEKINTIKNTIKEI